LKAIKDISQEPTTLDAFQQVIIFFQDVYFGTTACKLSRVRSFFGLGIIFASLFFFLLVVVFGVLFHVFRISFFFCLSDPGWRHSRNRKPDGPKTEQSGNYGDASLSIFVADRLPIL
jgi:hypothetical protein